MAVCAAARGEAAMLREGIFVITGRKCDEAQAHERIISNGNSVALEGQRCRLISRTSTGRYYPILNQRCMVDATSAESVNVHIQDSQHVRLRRPGSNEHIAYRHCPSLPVEEDAQKTRRDLK